MDKQYMVNVFWVNYYDNNFNALSTLYMCWPVMHSRSRLPGNYRLLNSFDGF